MDGILEKATDVAPLQMKGSMFLLMTLEINSFSQSSLCMQLKKWKEKLPDFFNNTPIVLIPEKIAASGVDFQQLKSLFKQFSLNVIAVKSNEISIQQKAIHAGLAVFPDKKLKDENRGSAINEPQAVCDDGTHQEKNTHDKTLFIDRPVRSGQQIYNNHGDIVLTAPVSAGAEIIAAGSIHVYSVLRGKALAGIHGSNSARIFCQRFEAELIAISGHFKPITSITDRHWKKSVQVSLSEEQFNFVLL